MKPSPVVIFSDMHFVQRRKSYSFFSLPCSDATKSKDYGLPTASSINAAAAAASTSRGGGGGGGGGGGFYGGQRSSPLKRPQPKYMDDDFATEV